MQHNARKIADYLFRCTSSWNNLPHCWYCCRCCSCYQYYASLSFIWRLL